MSSTLTADDREWLARVLARPSDVETRERYARALDDSSDPLRANVVRLTARAIATGTDVGLRDALGTPSSSAWTRLIGASLLAEMESLGVSGYAPRWMPHVLPALSLHLEPDPNEEDRPIGSTYFGGDPDLPVGTPWPTLADCATFFGEARCVDARSACHFIGQLALSDLRRGLFGATWPEQGLLSLFAFDEYDRHGISEIHVRYCSDISQLRRVRHPVLDEANQRRRPRRATLEHALTIPDDYEGPWSADVRLAPDDDRGVPGHSGSPRVRSYRHLMGASGGGRAGIFGHHTATTGADPTPDREWQRLFCVPDGDGVGWHHVAIRRTDLAACRLERWRSVWVDLDG